MNPLEITIIGAGNGGRAFAAYLARQGHSVNLCFRTEKNIKRIKHTHAIVASGVIEGEYNVNRVTSKYHEVVQDANLILVVLPAHVQAKTVKKFLPFLRNGQIILLNPGRTFGAIHVHNIIKRQRPSLNVLVGETQTLLFTCRKQGDWGVSISRIKDVVDYCFFPESDNYYVEELIAKLFPQLRPVNDILLTSLNNIGSVIHPAGLLLNAGSVGRGDQFEFYRDGMTPEVVRVIEAIDAERCTIMSRLGLPVRCLLEWMRETYACTAISCGEAFQLNKPYHGIAAPGSIDSRYLTEDVPTGLVPLASIARYLGIATPTIDALITLAGIVLCKDFWTTGRTVERVHLPFEVLDRASRATEDPLHPEGFSA